MNTMNENLNFSEIFKEQEKVPTLAELELTYIKFVLNRVKNKKEVAARLLGIDRKTLYRKEKLFVQPGSASPTEAMPSAPAEHHTSA